MSSFSQVNGERKPLRTILLPPSAFADSPQKPLEPRLVGLRLLSEGDLQAARSAAILKADRLHKTLPPDDPLWVETFNAALMLGAAVRALCNPEDTHRDYWEFQRGTAEMALSQGGVERIWDELEQLKIETSPTSPELSADDLRLLQDRLGQGMGAFDRVPAGDARAIRRLLRHVLDVLEVNDPPTT